MLKRESGLFLGNFYSKKVLENYSKKFKLSLGNDNYEKSFMNILRKIFIHNYFISFQSLPISNKNYIVTQREITESDYESTIFLGFKYSKFNYLFNRKKFIMREVQNAIRADNNIKTIFISTYNLFFVAKKIKKQYPTIKTVLLLPDLPNISVGGRFSIYKIRMHLLFKKMQRELKYVDLFLPITDYQMSCFKRKYNASFVYESFFDSSVFDPINKEWKKQILYAGSINKEYGVGELVSSFINSNVSKEYKLIICGDGNFKNELIEISKKHKNIIYLGIIPHEKVLQLERESTALVVPDKTTRQYSFHSRYLEYLSSGTPVISFEPAGAKKEYLDLLYSVENNGGTLAKALDKALTSDLDVIKNLGFKAREYMLNHKNLDSFKNELIKNL